MTFHSEPNEEYNFSNKWKRYSLLQNVKINLSIVILHETIWKLSLDNKRNAWLDDGEEDLQSNCTRQSWLLNYNLQIFHLHSIYYPKNLHFPIWNWSTCIRISMTGRIERIPLSVTFPTTRSRILATLEACILRNSVPPKIM